MRLIRLVGTVAVCLSCIATIPIGADDSLRDLLKVHCFRCHGEGKVKGRVNLSTAFSQPKGLVDSGELLGKIIDVLKHGDMPPEGEKQPSTAERDRWLTELNAVLKRSTPAIAKTPIRRMNRLEYNNAIKDLFELERDPFALPERTVRDFSGYFNPASGIMPDLVVVGNRAMGKSQFIGAGNTLVGVAAFPKDNRAEHGFDNRGDHLSLSPVLMESFFALGQSIVTSPEFPRFSGNWNSIFGEPTNVTVEQLRAVAYDRLNVLLHRAFRRIVSSETVNRYYRRFVEQLDAGRSFTESMRSAVSAALVSPRFLYIYSSTSSTPSAASDDFAIASRLSFFLWKSIPDSQLLDLAAKGMLRDPKVIGAQVDRMLDDPRVKSFCDSFALQWLQLDLLVAAVPDDVLYREYYFGGANGKIYMVGMHMMIEPLLLFETVFIEDRPIIQLVDPEFSYRSDLLRRWYDNGGEKGRNEVIGIKFRRVETGDRRWGGVITNAAVLTMTSSPVRTKPITRGAWLASTVFNDPPDPPPADVPELKEDDAETGAGGATLRDKLKQHVTRQDCAGCHKKIDPLGFALENYDAVGRWRETYGSQHSIDSSGVLFNKHQFDGVIGFKDGLVAERKRFARAFASHLLSYALGRKIDAGDRESLDSIVAKSAKDEYRIRTLIKQVVLSRSFAHTGSANGE